MTPRQTWVHLLVWLPADPSAPMDVSRAWPRVLQVVRDGGVGPPGVLLRGGESLRQAAARVSGALGLRAPVGRPALLAVDQWPAEPGAGRGDQMVVVLDGGALATAGLPPCGECGRPHLVWTRRAELGERSALAHALRARVLGHQPLTLWRGEPSAEN